VSWLLMAKYGSDLASSYPSLGVIRLMVSLAYVVVFFPIWLVWRYASFKREGDSSIWNAEYLGGFSWRSFAFWGGVFGKQVPGFGSTH